MQSINNRPHVRGPGEQSASGDGRTVSSSSIAVPAPAPSSRLYRPHITTSSRPRSQPPTSTGHPPLRATATGVVLRTSPSYKQHPNASSSNQPSSTSTRRSPLPPSFPLFFGAASNQSSTSIAPSTAEVRPAPVDGGTAALRELNTNFPSNVYRHRSAKSSGAQSTTYSQPVIVRTYNGPHGGGGGSNRANSGSRPVTTRTPLPATVDYTNGTKVPQHPRQAPEKSKSDKEDSSGSSKENGVVNDLWTSSSVLTSKPAMPRHPPPPHHSSAPKKRGFPLSLPWQWGDRSSGDDGSRGGGGGGVPGERPKYPPLEAFTMRGIIQAQRSTQSELDASLDQIAELYARSRYSLSNQYEVHVTPHGSGAGFASQQQSAGGTLTAGSRKKAGSTASGGSGPHHPGSHRGSSLRRQHPQLIGPTLQATWSEDEADESSAAAASASASGAAAKSHRKRRSGGGGARRKSVAYGTLETIMSSSRSSSEDKEKKKSASELTEEVRGRAERAAGRNRGGHDGGVRAADASSKGHPSGVPGELAGTDRGGERRREPRRKASASFAHAVIDSSRSRHETTSPRSSASALVSEPALPQTSTGEMDTRAIDVVDQGRNDTDGHNRHRRSKREERPIDATSVVSRPATAVSIITTTVSPRSRSALRKQEPTAAVEDPQAAGGLLAGLNGWMPWRGPTGTSQAQQPSPATDGLRDLLKNVDKRTLKGKGVERLG